ncbi:MAG: glycerophosphodiester phosphodiesterase [Microthrixaceae bacterium]
MAPSNPPMPIIIAHRGASADQPENSLAAFREAGEQGADGVELDVRLTIDEQLVLSHDHRLGDGTFIHRSTAEALRTKAPLEHLRAALDAASGIVNVEVKSDERAEQLARRMKVIELVLDELAAHEGSLRFVLSSFDLDILAMLADWGMSFPTAYLTMGVPRPELAMDAAVRMGCISYNPWYPEVDEALMAGARRRGLEVWTWTVNDFDHAEALSLLGVDALITDHPGAMREHLAAAGFVARPGDAVGEAPPA